MNTPEKQQNLTSKEQYIAAAGQPGLAQLLQKVRLENPYSPATLPAELWQEQLDYNVPLLILASIYIDQFCTHRNLRRILFSSRDCCHLIRIFQALFPSYEAIYFHTSRIAYRFPSVDYIQYMHSLAPKDTLIVDGNGGGDSCYLFWAKQFQCEPIWLSVSCNNPTRCGITYLSPSQTGGFERINYAQEGSLIGFDEQGPIRLPCEYVHEHLEPVYRCIATCVQYCPQFNFNPFDQNLTDHLLTELQNHNTLLEKYFTPVHTLTFFQQAWGSFLLKTPFYPTLSSTEKLRIWKALQNTLSSSELPFLSQLQQATIEAQNENFQCEQSQ